MKLRNLILTLCAVSLGSAAHSNTYLFSYYTGDTLRGVVSYDQTAYLRRSTTTGIFAPVAGATDGVVYDQTYFESYSNGGGVLSLVRNDPSLGPAFGQQLYSGDPFNGDSFHPVFNPGSYDFFNKDGSSAGKIVVDDITNKAVNLFVLQSPYDGSTRNSLILSYDTPSSYDPIGTGGFALKNFIGTSIVPGQPETAQAIQSVVFRPPSNVGYSTVLTIDGKDFHEMAPLYSGSSADPQFNFTGSASTAASGFEFYPEGTGGPTAFYMLQLSAGSVPEPATWISMIAGLGILGCVMRNRSQRKIPIPAFMGPK